MFIGFVFGVFVNDGNVSTSVIGSNCSGGIATATANASSKHSIAYRANYVRLKSFNLLNLNQIETFYRSLAFAYLLYINTSVSAFSQSTMRPDAEYSHAEKVCVHRGRK